ncbi:rCG43314 [Rattus norvegicus]|uniref:RCG43314 n=1 Tax=Rattus norvegicus TaxID=10116 RepID=A6IVP4_RAT|nr:rCG43314 [Rattus norvegicus]
MGGRCFSPWVPTQIRISRDQSPPTPPPEFNGRSHGWEHKDATPWESESFSVFLVTKGMGAGSPRRDPIYLCKLPT